MRKNGKLTRREAEVLTLMGRGLTYKEIATQLSISAETVKTHAHRTYKKLEVKNKTQAGLKYFNHMPH